MRSYISIFAGFFVVAVLSASPAWAEEEATAFASWGRPLSSTSLDSHRGGTSMPSIDLTQMQLTAKLFDNSAKFNVTGHNIVSEGAFSNASGLPTVIQNSGNNVIIQNATILNLTVK